MESLHWLVTQRQRGVLSHNSFSRGVRDSLSLVKRLKNTRVLEGHHGCVNSVSWNETGTKLISGSDDCHINIYDMTTDLMCHSFHTSHQSNIFSAKFLPQTGDCKAVSCAGIGSVEVSELTPFGECVSHQFKCQSSITYQVATSPGCPHEFFACEEMGIVRMYDLRTCSSCLCESNCNRSILCRFPSAVTSMAIHPLQPHYVAVGLGDGTLRMLDRRRTDYWQDSNLQSAVQVLHASCVPVQYRPAAIGDQKLKITCVNFNQDGTQIVASFSEDYVYVFNTGIPSYCSDFSRTPHRVSRPRYLSHCERYSGRALKQPAHPTKCEARHQKRTSSSDCGAPPANSASTQSSAVSVGAVGAQGRVLPAHKRIRLRGDWSDTGPEARPESWELELSQGEGRGNLVNRMSRLFERWMDIALDSVSEDEDEGEGERGESESSSTVNPLRGESSNEASSDTFYSASDTESDRPPDREGAAEPASSHLAGERGDLELIQAAAESSMQTVVQEAVQRAAGSPLGEDLTSSDAMERTRMSTGESILGDGSVRGREWAESVRQTVSRDTEGECDHSLPLSRPGELEFSSDEVTSAHLNNQSVPASPLAPCVRETPPTSPPTARGPRSCDRSPDHSYRRSRFRAQRKRGGRLGQVCGAEGRCEDGEQGELGEWEGSAVRGGRSPYESCPQLQPFMVYKGHRNSRTMIKQANFFGDNWVLSGSDCGRVFVWDKWSGEVVNIFTADSHVVNCVQPHPSAYVIATSGIDYNVKLWEPVAFQEASLSDLDEVIKRNEQMLQESRNTITIPSSFLLRILAYLNRSGRMRPSPEQQHGEPD